MVDLVRPAELLSWFAQEGDARPLVVLVAADQAGPHFAKGQRCRAEVEVARDGLVIAGRCEKR